MRVAGMSAKENRILDIAARNVNIVGWRFHALHGSPASTKSPASPAASETSFFFGDFPAHRDLPGAAYRNAALWTRLGQSCKKGAELPLLLPGHGPRALYCRPSPPPALP